MTLGAMKRFYRGIIVPFMGDEASPKIHQNRHMVTPQRYKIRMLDQTFKMMQGYTDTYAEKRQHGLI